MADLVELGVVDFDAILCMNWLYGCYAIVDVGLELSSFSFLISPS